MRDGAGGAAGQGGAELNNGAGYWATAEGGVRAHGDGGGGGGCKRRPRAWRRLQTAVARLQIWYASRSPLSLHPPSPPSADSPSPAGDDGDGGEVALEVRSRRGSPDGGGRGGCCKMA